jgi:adenylosuccinate lyase
MPHKKNPIISEQICGLARLMRGYALATLENNPLWHERDISNSSVERIVLPDASILMDYLLDRMTYLVADFVVHPDAMRRNLGLTGGRIFSETVMLALTRAGLRREQAYEIVQRNAMEGMRTGRPLRELLGADPEVTRRLDAKQLAAAFDPQHALRWTGAIYARIFGTRAKRRPAARNPRRRPAAAP